MSNMISQRTAQEIVETVKDVCGYDINFIRPDGIIDASTDPGRIGTFHEIGYKAAQTGQTLEVFSDDNFSGSKRGINMPFAWHGETIAVIGISGNPDDVRKYAFLAQRISWLVLRENEIDVRIRNQQAEEAYIIRALTKGVAISPSYLSDFLQSKNLSESVLCRTVVIRLNDRWNPTNVPMIEQQIKNCFKRTGSSLYTFNYPREYLEIIEEEKYQTSVAALRKLADSGEGILVIGVGSAEPLRRQNRSFDNAVLAARTAGKENEYFACYDDLDIAMLLSVVPEDARERYQEKTVSVLSEKEKEILTAYFAHGCRLKETAEALFLHKNTLQYQLDGIWHHTGYNPRNFREAVVLYMGLLLATENESSAAANAAISR